MKVKVSYQAKPLAALHKRMGPLRHTCHWPGCNIEVPPKMWGCRAHWFSLPLVLRRKVWATFRPGQEVDKKPSPAYLAVAAEIQRWIKQHGATK